MATPNEQRPTGKNGEAHIAPDNPNRSSSSLNSCRNSNESPAGNQELKLNGAASSRPAALAASRKMYGNPGDTLPVITASCPYRAGGACFAKDFTKGDTPRIVFPRLVTPRSVPVTSIFDIHDVLVTLQNDPSSCIIRGITDAPENGYRNCRRSARNFADTPHHFVAFEFDRLPPGITTPEQAVNLLPACFHGVTFVWRHSASSGIKPGLRGHAWFWLQGEMTSFAWSQWLDTWGGYIVEAGGKTEKRSNIPVDPALFRAVQPHFTADPILGARSDPMKGRPRLMLIEGTVDYVAQLTCGKYRPRAETRENVIAMVEPLDAENIPGPIGAYLRKVDIGTTLRAYGYTPVDAGHGGQVRWLRPGSPTSVSSGITEGGRYWAFSSEDPLFETAVDNLTGETRAAQMNAFDVRVTLGFHGDRDAAISHIREKFGDGIDDDTAEKVARLGRLLKKRGA